MSLPKSLHRTDALFVLVALSCLFPFISSPVALVLGITLSSIGWVPEWLDTAALTKKLLAFSIVGLGFGIQLDQAIAASSQGIGLIVVSILGTLIIGFLLTRLLGIETKTGHLIASGTAICGGSAIAAVAPAIDARNDQTSLALATVFILNSVALLLFPLIGSALDMSQNAFGLWAAIAIHDTSSVVGAAGAYGDEALITATTLKLARALWIIPVALISAFVFKGGNRSIKIPYFIVFYCLAIVFAWWQPNYQFVYETIFDISKRLLVICLFLIGCSITLNKLRTTGASSLILGILLWIGISTASLTYIQLTLN